MGHLGGYIAIAIIFFLLGLLVGTTNTEDTDHFDLE